MHGRNGLTAGDIGTALKKPSSQRAGSVDVGVLVWQSLNPNSWKMINAGGDDTILYIDGSVQVSLSIKTMGSDSC